VSYTLKTHNDYFILRGVDKVIVGNPKYNFLRSFQEFNLILKNIPGVLRTFQEACGPCEMETTKAFWREGG